MTDYAPYEYAEEILQILGFAGISDYETLVYYDTITDETIEKVNNTMDRFKGLFKLREFNLSRYGYMLSNRTQLLNFVRKILSQLDVTHETDRHQGKNFLRLKSPNKTLRDYIMQKQNVATGSQKLNLKDLGGFGGAPIGPPKQPLKTKLMSDVMRESKSTTAVNEQKIYFYCETSLHGLDCLDVITGLESSAPFRIVIGRSTHLESVKSGSEHVMDLVYPISMVKYHEFEVFTTHYNQLMDLTVRSCGLNKLRFDYSTHRIILDCPVFQSKYAIFSGMCCGLEKGTPSFKPPLKSADCKPESFDISALGHTFRIVKGCTCVPKTNDVMSDAIACLLIHTKEYDGSLYEKLVTLKLHHIDKDPTTDLSKLYYSFPREADIDYKIEPNVPFRCSLNAGPLSKEIKPGCALLHPGITTGLGPVTGHGLCPDIFHVADVYLVLHNVPLDKLFHYKALRVKVTGIVLDCVQRNTLAQCTSDQLKEYYQS